ncbi:hypothetical protein [Acidithiobacillus ferriphilus]|uniref:hypothetical protein n=1 Tax=Acidithiobacillus ferriphilus TaxID=1689834 RepID=UPI002DB646D5|nr:hypothetical protein [Acidithiobacillus ferriphilus]MEB8474253.1 hypothetical protein [Acidithiobacillus ferriphilus]
MQNIKIVALGLIIGAIIALEFMTSFTAFAGQHLAGFYSNMAINAMAPGVAKMLGLAFFIPGAYFLLCTGVGLLISVTLFQVWSWTMRMASNRALYKTLLQTNKA